MIKFRLKKEAIPFFSEDIAVKIMRLHEWQDNYHVDKNALEEVKPLYVSYGIKSGENSSSLSGWDEKGSRFHFTLHFPSVKFNEHDKFSKGKSIRKLMDRMQEDLNSFYEEFSVGENQ